MVGVALPPGDKHQPPVPLPDLPFVLGQRGQLPVQVGE
jgi:hypothetical protein